MLPVTAYGCTNLTLRQLAPSLGASQAAADRVIRHLGPLLALRPRKRFRKETVLIVDGALVPLRDHTVAVPPCCGRVPAARSRYAVNSPLVNAR